MIYAKSTWTNNILNNHNAIA